MRTTDQPGFAVYVHWPFCKAKCPYCDFNSHVRPDAVADDYAAALVREIGDFADRTPGRTVTSIFFGGGTPSLMPPSAVGQVIDAVAGRWSLSPWVEITLEANPTSVEASNFDGYAAAGVNRLSLGVQALDDASLKALGREHSVAEAMAALDIAQTRFNRVSFDLIYARPAQTVAAWTHELSAALERGTEHLSLYQLTIEPGTPFAARHKRGTLVVPDDDSAIALYEITQDLCNAAGMPAYEVSNHARPGAESRHNLTYWRYGEYVGVGPGAHGRLIMNDARHALQTIRTPAAWLAAVNRRGNGIADDTALLPQEAAEELLLMGLRLSEGVSLDRFADLRGGRLRPGTLSSLAEEGLLQVSDDGRRIAATARGRQVLNALIAALLTSLEAQEAA
ncbi:oxygen-independent coproporphyrinogen-3 oxidase [Rhodoligotrophos appendicifer]|uniref:radical SAM family heme chaperone HemW n=1 Tax=Rhodoligotrophos appendicifer TaxID=987056 RepID=UPI001180ADFB|nr:radical SAM family heme chaperone HemW [Rhodoligotrophos appendicifer]